MERNKLLWSEDCAENGTTIIIVCALTVIYLTCTLVITTLSMVLTVLVLNIYGTADHPVPVWMRDVVLIFIARTLGMCDTARTYQERKDIAAAAARTERHRARLRDTGAGLNFVVRTAMVGREREQRAAADEEDAASSTYFEMTERSGGGAAGSGSADDCESLPPERVPLRQRGVRCATPLHGLTQGHSGVPTYLEMTERSGGGAAGSGSADDCESLPPERVPLRQPGARCAGLYTEPLKDNSAVPDYSKDWKRVAEIVDRLLFWRRSLIGCSSG